MFSRGSCATGDDIVPVYRSELEAAVASLQSSIGAALLARFETAFFRDPGIETLSKKTRLGMDLQGPKEWVVTAAIVVSFIFFPPPPPAAGNFLQSPTNANRKLVVHFRLNKGDENLIDKMEETTCFISADSVFTLTPTWMFKVEAYSDYTFGLEVFTDDEQGTVEQVPFTVAKTSQFSVVAVPTTIS